MYRPYPFIAADCAAGDAELPETGNNLVIDGKNDGPVYEFGSETKYQ